jgi:hypothetical protein
VKESPAANGCRALGRYASWKGQEPPLPRAVTKFIVGLDIGTLRRASRGRGRDLVNSRFCRTLSCKAAFHAALHAEWHEHLRGARLGRADRCEPFARRGYRAVWARVG